MIEIAPLAPHILFRFGPLAISEAVVTTWGLTVLLAGGAWLATRRLKEEPSPWQTVLEALVTGIAEHIREVIHQDPRPFLPLIGTLFVFLVTANLSAQLPGVSAPTAQLETAAAQALIVFFAGHGYGIRRRGLKAYLARYLRPNPLMLPLNVLSELTRTFSLMVRLFGNIASHEIVIAIVIALAGLFVPIPLMALGILIGLVQAYIFTVLATVYLGAAVGAFEID
jgi:F-type H+-transporting ATPase subunit a